MKSQKWKADHEHGMLLGKRNEKRNQFPQRKNIKIMYSVTKNLSCVARKFISRIVKNFLLHRDEIGVPAQPPHTLWCNHIPSTNHKNLFWILQFFGGMQMYIRYFCQSFSQKKLSICSLGVAQCMRHRKVEQITERHRKEHSNTQVRRGGESVATFTKPQTCTWTKDFVLTFISIEWGLSSGTFSACTCVCNEVIRF